MINIHLLTDNRLLRLAHLRNIKLIPKRPGHGRISPRLKRRDPAGLMIRHRAHMRAYRGKRIAHGGSHLYLDPLYRV